MVTAGAGFGARRRLPIAFLVVAVFAVAFAVTVFFAEDFFAVAFLAGAFLAAVFLAAAFLAAAFFAAALRPAGFVFDFCFDRLAMRHTTVKDADGRDEPGHDASRFTF